MSKTTELTNAFLTAKEILASMNAREDRWERARVKMLEQAGPPNGIQHDFIQEVSTLHFDLKLLCSAIVEDTEPSE